jgi:hypothetical protein
MMYPVSRVDRHEPMNVLVVMVALAVAAAFVRFVL